MPAESALPAPRPLADRLLPVSLVLTGMATATIQVMEWDTWWHLRTGELILETGRIPYVDWYTYPDADQPWFDLHWLFQVLIALLDRAGGLNAIVLFKSACYGLTLFVGWRASGSRLPAAAKGLIWLPALVCLMERPYDRPEMLSLPFLALTLWIWENAESRPGRLWWLPLIQVVWTNAHGLFVLGLIVTWAYVAEFALRGRWGGRGGLSPAPDGPSPRMLFGLVVLTALATLFNPYFEQGASFPLTLYRKFSVDHAFYAQSVTEFLTPLQMLGSAYGDLFAGAALIVFATATAALVRLASLGALRPARIALLLAFGHLAWSGWRNLNLLGLVGGMIACATLGEVWALRRSPSKSTTSTERTHRISASAVVCLVYAVVAIGAVTDVWAKAIGSGRRFGLGELPGEFPHAAMRFAARPEMPDRAFVTDFGQAAVYVYYNAPDRRVFVDGRLEVVRRETFERYRAALESMRSSDGTPEPAWEALIRDEAGRLPAIVVPTRGGVDLLAGVASTPGWRLVYADRVAFVFVDAGYAERVGLPEIPPPDPHAPVDPDVDRRLPRRRP